MGRKKWMLVAGIGLLAVVIAAGLLVWNNYFSPQNQLPPSVTLAEFEQISGIRPKMVAVTAAGGIIDFRYKVIDADKANAIMTHPQRYPRLVIKDTGQVMNPGINHVIKLYEGIGYFIFFPNVANVVHPGMDLSVVVDQISYGPVVVQ